MNENIKPIVMPKWGLAMVEGMLTKWHVEEGADIRPGVEICDIETSKIANAMESTVAGKILRRVASEGSTLPVGALMAVVGEGASAAEVDAFIKKFDEEFATAASKAAAEEPAGGKVTVAGRQVNYVRAGQAGGTPIIFVHGFAGDLNSWMFNQPMLAQDHTTYAVDLPGHGASDKSVSEGTVKEFAEGLIGFMDGLKIERAHFVGQSLGGAIVLQLAAEKPALVASLTLISSAGLGPDINMDYINGFLSATGRKDLRPQLEKLFAEPSLVSRDMINDVLKYKRLDGVDGVLRKMAEGAFGGGKQKADLRAKLAAINVPIQVIFGAKDQIIPAEHAKGLPANVKVHVIPDTGHMPHMEAAGEVNRLIASIVDS